MFNTATVTYIDEFHLYKKVIPWLKSLKLYQLIKSGKIQKHNDFIDISNVEYTWVLIMVCFKGTRFRHRSKSIHTWFYRNGLQQSLRQHGFYNVRDLRRYCYSKHDEYYTFYTTSKGKFGPDVGYFICKDAFKTVQKLANRVTITGYPIVVQRSNIGYLHRYLYLKFIGPTQDIVDHINGRQCDLRLHNLRTGSYADNAHNKAYRQENDFFIGIFRLINGEWGTKLDAATFPTAIQAAKYYDKYVVQKKAFARTNKALGYY